jgi:hypothetical protein
MSWTPTDEQVEKAARVRFHQAQGEGEAWEEWGTSWHHLYRTEARAVLVAVGPMIAARALRDAAERTYHAACAAGLANDADTIEKEAGR